jgi:two-component sensor histidine kinase/ligand-binding sensor protein
MKDLKICDLLDISILRNLSEAHFKTSGVTIAIVDATDGSILVGVGWQDICLLYHRAHPVSLENCHESDNIIKKAPVVGEPCGYKCKNGLWDVGVPIMAEGRHLATLFIGQFFYEDEIPDREYFVRQARELGFDIEEYLAALDRVPVFSRAKVDDVLEYNKALARFVSDLCERAVRQLRAEERLKVSLLEKDVLLREIHHRVKNNLQIVSTLLGLQSDYLSDEQTLRFFRESQERIMSMALVHEKLYQSRDFAAIDFSGYITELTEYLFRSYLKAGENITLKIDAEDVSITIDQAVPCGLIINELVTNSMKHAFPRGRKGEVSVGLHVDADGRVMLNVADNGVGLPTWLDFRHTESLGLQIVNMLARQLQGTLEAKSGNGTTITVCFRSVPTE